MTRSPRRLREQVKDTVSELPIQAARLAVMGVGRALLLTDRVRKDYRDVRESGLRPVLGRLKNDAENITGMVVDKVAGNGTTEEDAQSRGDSEISVGKPRSASPTRPSTPAKPAKPATAPPSRPAAASRPKPPTAAKPTAAKSAASKPAAKPTEKPAEKPAASKPATKPASKPAAKPAAKATAKPKPAAQDKPSPAAKPKAAAPKPAAKPKASTTEKAPAKPAAKPASKSPAAESLPVTGYDKATIASVRARLRGLDAKQVGELRDYERSHAARAEFLRMYENRIAKLRGEH